MNPPASADEAFQRAVRAHQGGDLESAEAAYRDALALAPQLSPACNNLGMLLAMTNRLDEAIEHFRQALRGDPRSVDASTNLAQALQHSGQHEQALRQWQHAASLAPSHMEISLSGALLAMHLGATTSAIDMLEQAAGGHSKSDDARATLINAAGQLGGALLDADALDDAHRVARLLVRVDPDNDVAPRLLERCLRNAQVREFDTTIKSDLLRCYRCEVIDHRHLGRISAQLLVAQYPVLRDRETKAWIPVFTDHGLHRDPLLLELLLRSINVDEDLEFALRAVRAELLYLCGSGDDLDDDWQTFSAALAMQCFANEYVFTQAAHEHQAVQKLVAKLAGGDRNPNDGINWGSVATICAWQAPHQLEPQITDALTRAIEDKRAPGWILDLLQRTLIEPQIEQRILASLDAGGIDDHTSREVQSQYEESPYPRWQNLELQVPVTVADWLRESINTFTPPPLFNEPTTILIAGCGTGEHALRVASRHADCRVEAIDLSRASIAYAMRKAQELDIRNISFRHQDILSLGGDKARYAMIESVGVIHHMRDPGAGLAALCECLAPDGIIKLGLYARAARTQVNLARRRIAELGLNADAQGMREFRERILSGAEEQLRALCASQDFWTLSTVRDLLFHVQEHQYDCDELRALLDAHALQVIGFAAPTLARQRYLQRFDNEPAMNNLAHWAQIEQAYPGTFAGMYQFWCRR